MTSLEKAAKAIRDCGAYSPDWQGADEDLMIMARTVVQALMEPTEGMIEALHDNIIHDVQTGLYCGDDPSEAKYAAVSVLDSSSLPIAYRALIRSILDEKAE